VTGDDGETDGPGHAHTGDRRRHEDDPALSRCTRCPVHASDGADVACASAVPIMWTRFFYAV